MTADDFVYSENFPTLSSGIVNIAIDIVSAQWYGALLFWSGMDADIRDKKRNILLNLLLAWYLSNKYPGEVTGIISNGGIPLTSKSIGGVSTSFMDFGAVQDTMKPLVSNSFGVDALEMILSAPERFTILG